MTLETPREGTHERGRAFVPSQAIPATPTGVGGHVMRGDDPRLPLVVAVHGIARKSRETLGFFADQASARGYGVLAPFFDEVRFDDFQRMGRRGRGERADLALLDTIDRLSGGTAGSGQAAARRVFLVGYSAGAQFVHRFMMAHPERVLGAVCLAAGWYTLPDPRRAYPLGMRTDGSLPGVRFEPSRFLRIPTLVAVGSADTEQDEGLRLSKRVVRTQGTHRVERAHRWTEAMTEAAHGRSMPSRVRCQDLAGAGHSLGECVRAGVDKLAFDFFDDILTRVGS